MSLFSTVNEYIMSVPEACNYSVGVQALDQSYAGSKFTFAQTDFTEIEDVSQSTKCILRTSEGFIVKSEAEEAVKVFNLEGKLLVQEMTNRLISIQQNGVYIVNVDGTVFKVVK